jgi:hypothetical protein
LLASVRNGLTPRARESPAPSTAHKALIRKQLWSRSFSKPRPWATSPPQANIRITSPIVRKLLLMPVGTPHQICAVPDGQQSQDIKLFIRTTAQLSSRKELLESLRVSLAYPAGLTSGIGFVSHDCPCPSGLFVGWASPPDIPLLLSQGPRSSPAGVPLRPRRQIGFVCTRLRGPCPLGSVPPGPAGNWLCFADTSAMPNSS